MTRDEIKALFPEATDEQIGKLLNSHHTELTRAKDEIKAYKDKAKAYDDAQAEKLSAEEKLKAMLEAAEKSRAENQTILNKTKAALKFAEAGIAEENYSGFLDGIVSEDEERTLALADSIIKSIGAVTERAKAAAKEELLASTPVPGAGTADAGTPPSKQDDYNNAVKSGNFLDIIKAADAMAAET